MVVKAKVRNVRTGSNVELSWGGGEKVEPAQIEKREMQYLYDTDEAMVFWIMRHMTRWKFLWIV